MSAPLHYIELQPCAALAPHIECYWVSEGTAAAGTTTRVLPDGCSDIIVDLRTGVGASRVVGTMQTASLVPLRGPVSMLGVRFRASLPRRGGRGAEGALPKCLYPSPEFLRTTRSHEPHPCPAN